MSDRKQQQPFQYNTVPTSDNTLHTLFIEKERLIVPIIFIPGVMGSNLKERTTKSFSKPIWRLDGNMSAIGWSFPHYGTAKARKLELDPDKTEVDDRGTVVDAAEKECSQIEDEFSREKRDIDEDEIQKYIDAYNIKQQKIEEAIKNNPENKRFGTRKERGWGTVGYISYGEFLEKFQESLFEPKGHTLAALNKLIQAPLFTLDEGSKTSLIPEDEQIAHCNNFYFPIHAMGYNWLESNEDSANRLKELIEVTLPRYYKKRGQNCDKVILITHSMGGLVARYYTQVLGGSTKVYGVINGVQPSTGAVAAYTRMKRGTEVNSTFIGKIEDGIMENVLGKDAAEMTAVCAQAPGNVTTSYGTHHVNHGNIKETYRLQPADGNGDGTVPRCSGEIPMDYLMARLRLPIGHEPAYKSEVSQEFTLRAIVNILQQVMVND
ncbi:lipase family alpha/beta hydrolase [Orbus mooreae]|uniref:lipase family alpha/beta hydrolase n=1 Tax=Orbus mooreae TaxID=3074107 RepID=UPI00370DA722